MSNIADRIANLSPEKRKALEALLAKSGGKAQQPRIPRRSAADATPLSFAQQRIWFIDQLVPNSSFYNICAAVRLSGRLDTAALQRALGAIVARHEILRTTFREVDGQPAQVIAPVEAYGETPLPALDLRAFPADVREDEAQRAMSQAEQRPFDLGRGPLVRALLLQLEPDEHMFLVTAHHIVFDGWSVGVFVRELSTLYDFYAGAASAPLAELPIQYADFALWQRRRLEVEGALDAQLDYWKRHLDGAPPLLLLPTDRSRPPFQTFQGADHTFVVPASLTDALKTLSRGEEATLFMALLAAFQTLLARYSSQTDIVVATSVANRSRREIEPLIGCFVNILLLRANLSGDPPFRVLLGRVRQAVQEAYTHQDLPFEKLVEVLQPRRDRSYNPLAQVMLVMHTAPQATAELEGLTISPVTLERTTAEYDLLLRIKEIRGELGGLLEYNSDLFDAATIGRMIGHFETLLAAIAVDPALPVSTLPLLTEAERRQLLVEWNATAVAYPDGVCLHTLIEAQAARTPDAIAVVFDRRPPTTDHRPPTTDRRGGAGETSEAQRAGWRGGDQPISNLQSLCLTYRELDQRANQLAHYLRSHGVGPEALVGICMHRSPELLVALLGVLKAGGAYVPLDPNYPAERLAFMVEDAQVQVLLTAQRGRGEEGETASLPLSPSPLLPLSPSVIDLNTERERIAQQPTDEPRSDVTGEDLAYVIYTSGSTGKPKGVQVRHRGLTNFLSAMREQPGLTADDTLLAVTTLSFDIAGLELYLPLLVGARLVLASAEDARDPLLLQQRLRSCGASVLQATPATWGLLLASGWAGDPQLTALCGGEALPPDLAAQLRTRTKALWNLYGPTETTIWSTCQLVGAEALPGIGRPIANTEVYILDHQMQPVPIGVPGELYIGGAGLARGYLNRPDLTAERFVPNPFTQEGLEIGDWRLSASTISNLQSPISERLYRTGDLCRYRSDGAIEYLGRIDTQVKLRGFRIELGEIEATLRRHPDVREAVVALREDAPGEKRLVAYVVTGDQRLEIGDSGGVNLQSPISNLPQELRQFLRTRLPDYMIPAAFVLLDALPLTPSGKLDRRGLPAHSGLRPQLGQAFVAPQTPAEAQIAEIWRELLRIEQVGIHDDFFELGGHSLLLTQLASRIRKGFLIDVPLHVLFDAPTIAAMAASVAAAQGEQSQVVDIERMLRELEQLSPDEARALLAAEKPRDPPQKGEFEGAATQESSFHPGS